MPPIDPSEIAAPASDMEVLTRARAMARDDAPDADRVMASRAPSALDLVDSRMLVSGAVAVVMFALVELNAARQVSPLDALDLALRMVALGATARAGLALTGAVGRFRSALRRSRRTLVLTDTHLVVIDERNPNAHVVVRREHVVGAHGGRLPEGGEELVAFVANDTHPPLVPIDLVTGYDPAIGANRVRRWSGRTEPRETSEYPAATRTPAEDFARIVGGERRFGEYAVPAGRRWLARGPYAAGAFVVVLGERSLHLPPGTGLGTPVLLLALACLLLPLGWLALTLRRRRAMGGAAMVLTPAELLVRDARGIHRAPWGEVTALSLGSRRSWTLTGGMAIERTLVVERAASTDISFDERWLGISAPALAALLETYGEGVFDPGTPASQGSATGTGISDIGDTET